MLEVNYTFKPEFKLQEEYEKQMVVSYAGELLEAVGSPTVIVTLDDASKPVILQVNGRLHNVLDYQIDSY